MQSTSVPSPAVQEPEESKNPRNTTTMMMRMMVLMTTLLTRKSRTGHPNCLGYVEHFRICHLDNLNITPLTAKSAQLIFTSFCPWENLTNHSVTISS